MVTIDKLRECAEWIKANYGSHRVDYNEQEGLSAHVDLGGERDRIVISICARTGELHVHGGGHLNCERLFIYGNLSAILTNPAGSNHIAGGPSVRDTGLATDGTVQEVHRDSYGWEIVIGTNDFGHIRIKGDGDPPLAYGAGLKVTIRTDNQD